MFENTITLLESMSDRDRRWNLMVEFLMIRKIPSFIEFRELTKICCYLIRTHDIEKFLIVLNLFDAERLDKFCFLLEKHINTQFFDTLREDIIKHIKSRV